MGYYVKTACPRCGMEVTGNYYDPCPTCKKDLNVNYETIFDVSGAKLPPPGTGRGIFRFSDFFALDQNSIQISLDEGNTPLRKLDRLGKYFGLEQLYMKDETRNPTMSHKDRMCALMVSKAIEDGAPGMTAASSGNQGASIAAYSKIAGIPCVIFTTANVSYVMKTLIQAYGAYVFVTPSSKDRLLIMEQVVRNFGFAPASGLHYPPIGSNCFALDAYKTIAFEIYEQLGNSLPDWFIVPVSYGDTLYGVHKGMKDLQEMGLVARASRMVAVDVFGATDASLKAEDGRLVFTPETPSIQTSIATGTTTYLTVRAIRESEGLALSSRDEEALEMQKVLAQTEGVFAETASVASLVALKKLLDAGKLYRDEKVVLLITSVGIKDPEICSLWLPEVPSIKPVLEEFLPALEKSYGCKLGK